MSFPSLMPFSTPSLGQHIYSWPLNNPALNHKSLVHGFSSINIPVLTSSTSRFKQLWILYYVYDSWLAESTDEKCADTGGRLRLEHSRSLVCAVSPRTTPLQTLWQLWHLPLSLLCVWLPLYINFNVLVCVMSIWLLDQSKTPLKKKGKTVLSNTFDKPVRRLHGLGTAHSHVGVGRFWDLWQEPAKGAILTMTDIQVSTCSQVEAEWW